MERGLGAVSYADSSTKRNKGQCNGLHLQPEEYLVRRAIAQTLARSVVEQIHRIIDLLLAYLQEVGLLGKVLTQQAIVVLIEPTLLRAVRVRKVHPGAQALSYESVVCELFPIVKGQRVALPLVRPQQRYYSLSDARAMA